MRAQSRLITIAGVVAILAACSTGPATQTGNPQTAAPSPTASELMPAPIQTAAAGGANSYELLNAALASGAIDDEQALVLKIFAAFNDPRLPAEYRGDDAELHDGLVIAEALARWDELAAETQAVIAPFTLWPGDAGSWLHQRVAGAPIAMAGFVAQAPGVIRPVEGSPNVRVWYRSDRPADEAVAQSIVGMVDSQVWPKLTELMGPPLSDLGQGNPEGNGEDGRIDIVLSGEDIRSFARPFDCHQMSGFIQLGVSATDLHVVAHELMHVIQFKYPVSTGCQSPDYDWLHEAGAQWAIDYVDPASQAERGKKTGLLPKKCFLDVPGYPLDLSNDCHEYGAYLFFQYLDKSYAPSYIPAVWTAAAGEDGLGAIDAVVASAGGLAEVWPDFALAAYNVDPSTRFQTWDSLPFGARVIEERVALDGAHSREFAARGDVEHAAALYTGFRFEDANIQQVVFSHPFTGNPAARVTAVVKWEGEAWKVEDWTPFAEKTFCFENEGQKRLEQLVVIVSNSSQEGGPLSGPQPKLTVADSCVAADVTITFDSTSHLHEAHWTVSGNLEPYVEGMPLGPDQPIDDLVGTGTYTGRAVDGLTMSLTYIRPPRCERDQLWVPGNGEVYLTGTVIEEGWPGIDGPALLVTVFPVGEDFTLAWGLGAAAPLEGGYVKSDPYLKAAVAECGEEWSETTTITLAPGVAQP